MEKFERYDKSKHIINEEALKEQGFKLNAADHDDFHFNADTMYKHRDDKSSVDPFIERGVIKNSILKESTNTEEIDNTFNDDFLCDYFKDEDFDDDITSSEWEELVCLGLLSNFEYSDIGALTDTMMQYNEKYHDNRFSITFDPIDIHNNNKIKGISLYYNGSRDANLSPFWEIYDQIKNNIPVG